VLVLDWLVGWERWCLYWRSYFRVLDRYIDYHSFMAARVGLPIQYSTAKRAHGITRMSIQVIPVRRGLHECSRLAMARFRRGSL